MTNPPITFPRPAQAVFMLCEPDRSALRALVDEIEKRLDGCVAAIRLYGISPKRREGFIVVEAGRSFPTTFVEWLKDEQGITDYVMYNTSGPQQERATIAELATWYAPRLLAPSLPAGYAALDKPVSIDRPSDEIWIARALSNDEAEGEGVLIYGENQALWFLTPEEAINTLVYLFGQARALVAACPQEYLQAPQHREQLAAIRRALLAIEPDQLELPRQTKTTAATALQELDAWLQRNHYRLVPDEERESLRLIPDDREDGSDDEQEQEGERQV
jgi:hypothetical protein